MLKYFYITKIKLKKIDRFKNPIQKNLSKVCKNIFEIKSFF